MPDGKAGPMPRGFNGIIEKAILVMADSAALARGTD
jgi:hypothetical protein